MKFRITVEALDADPDNDNMDYIADTSELRLVTTAEGNWEALEKAASGSAELES